MHKSSPLKRSKKKTPMKRLSKSKNEIIYSRLKATTSDSLESLEDNQSSSGLFDDEKCVEGKNMLQVTPKKLKKTDMKTPGKISTPHFQNGTPSLKAETPKENRYSLRQQMKQDLASLKSLHIESDPEDSDENSDPDEEAISTAEEAEDQLPNRKKVKPISQSFSDTYFTAQRQKKTTTSNRTLSHLKIKQTNIEELQEIIKKTPEYHKKEKDLLFKNYRTYFEKWIFLLKQGFSVLLYGFGSKQIILNSFCKDCLEDSLYVVIHGYFPSLSVKQILNSITEDALDYDGKFASVNEHAEYIKKRFSEGNEELYLIFHNIDGVRLRSVKTQEILSSLASVSNIHFVCSADHMNCPLIWDQIMLSHYKWVWFDITTFEPYILETSYENSIFKDQSSHLLLSSLLHVYRSLTPNGQGVFMILANYQQEQNNAANSGITFHEWYQDCREAFLVNSEITMQAQLSEFKNHKLLSSRKSAEGIELWYIPVDNATLEQFLDTCK